MFRDYVVVGKTRSTVQDDGVTGDEHRRSVAVSRDQRGCDVMITGSWKGFKQPLISCFVIRV